ncbi:hypothetical protein GCM10010104_61320 [Streptomyces indiaensis]|uniref:Uncharacterized protein n=1 Tax=Streptomyces indiaensis TaxID=284033 RepID=A0ABN3EDZ6_9ACTN
MSCIHVPAFDTKFATDHQRMLRYRSDRQGEREAGRAGEGEEKEDTVLYSKTSRRTQEVGPRGASHRRRCTAASLGG